MTKCSIEGCQKKVKQCGMCSTHYNRQWLCGDATKRTKFDKNDIIHRNNYAIMNLYDSFGSYKGNTKIDLDDIEKIKDIKWGLNSNGYALSANNIYLHRFISPIKSKIITHINKDKLDNRKSNLGVGGPLYERGKYSSLVVFDGDICTFTILNKDTEYSVIIDKKYSEKVLSKKWNITSHGYVSSKDGYLHHFIIGKPNKGYVVDHVNCDKKDNRLVNLRMCDYYGNSHNTRPRGEYKGVSYDKSRKKWAVYITAKGKHYSLGRYDNPEEAAIVYNNAAVKYHGEFARLNKVNYE